MSATGLPVASSLLHNSIHISPEISHQLERDNPQLFASWKSTGLKPTYKRPCDESSGPVTSVDRGLPLGKDPIAQALCTGEQWFSVGDVSDRDPRVGLRGEKCLIAIRPFRAGDTIGVYGMWLATQDEFFCALNDVIMTKGPMQGMEMHRYAMGIKSQPIRGLHLKATAAYGYGNQMRLINDGRLDPYADVSIFALQPNVRFEEVLLAGVLPLVLVRATAPIEPGNELVADYGAVYWNAIKSNMVALAAWATSVTSNAETGEEKGSTD